MTSPQPIEVLHLPVRTKSGQALGIVTDVSIDPATQGVMSYTVRAHRLLPAAIARELVIARHQVITIDDQGMVVDDTTLPSAAPAPQPAT